MAEHDELAQLREDLTQQQAASLTLLGIVKETDRKVDELTGAVRSIEAHQTIIDSRLNTLDALMRLNFNQVAQALAQTENRLNKRIDALGDQLAQVLALLTRKEE